MQKPIVRLIIRWFVCSLGLWIAASLLSNSIHYGNSIEIVVAGLVLAIINTIIKPILVVLSLPAIIFSVGLFMIIINGVCVYLASLLYRQIKVGSFWYAVFAGAVIGLVNYLVTAIVER